MNKEECDEIQSEIAKLVLAEPSELMWSTARELANYTVAFVAAKGDELAPAGTATLVWFQGTHYFLTAAHVWEKGLKRSDAIKIPLSENRRTRFAINPAEIVAFQPEFIGGDPEWGPDVALLRIPPERVGSFTAAGRTFYPLSVKRERALGCAAQTWFLLGAPALSGIYTSEFAIPEIQGMNVITGTGPFLSLAAPPEVRKQFDYIEIAIDTTQPHVPPNFMGVSGGGLWRVYFFKGDDGKIQSFKILDGVAYFQIIRDSRSLVVRCHGPQTIGAALRSLIGSDHFAPTRR
jgi:hypothetical protein